MTIYTGSTRALSRGAPGTIVATSPSVCSSSAMLLKYFTCYLVRATTDSQPQACQWLYGQCKMLTPPIRILKVLYGVVNVCKLLTPIPLTRSWGRAALHTVKDPASRPTCGSWMDSCLSWGLCCGQGLRSVQHLLAKQCCCLQLIATPHLSLAVGLPQQFVANADVGPIQYY